MLASQIGVVLCRVGAAVLVVQAIGSLTYTIPGLLFADNNLSVEVWGFVLLGFVPALAAAGLWVFADRICRLPGAADRDRAEETADGVDILRIGTSLIGLYLLADGTMAAASVEMQHWMLPDLGDKFDNFMDEATARTMGFRAAYVVEIVLGIVLIAGRDRIARLLER